MIFTSYLSHYEALLQQKYKLSGTIQHKGEKGRQRENGLAMFLKETLPAAYGVATGEIIPVVGKKASPQCDIIIYDRLRMPIFGAGEPVQQIPFEAVYSVIETKSILDQAALDDAFVKFSAINSMPRAKSKTRLRKGMLRGPTFFVFGYRSGTSDEAYKEFMSRFCERREAAVVALSKGCGIWIEEHPNPIWLNTTDEKEGWHETLALFFVSLLEELRSIDLGSPNFLEYWGNT